MDPEFNQQKLLTSLVSSDWRERRSALALLERVNDEELAQALLAEIQQNYGDLSALSGALQALEQIGRSLTGELTGLLRGPNRDLRIYAPLVLGELGDFRALAPLVEMIRDREEDENARFNAIEALSKLDLARAQETDRQAAYAALREVLTQGTPYLRYAAALAIGKTNHPGLAADLLPLLDDPYLSEPSVIALGRLANSADVAVLITRWLEKDSVPAQAALSAVSALASIARRSPDPRSVRSAFVRSCGEKGRSSLAALMRPKEIERCKEEEFWSDLAEVFGWLAEAGDMPARNALAELVRCPSARQVVQPMLNRSPLPLPPALLAMAESSDVDLSGAALNILVSLAAQVAEMPKSQEVQTASLALAQTFVNGLAADDEMILTRSAEGLSRLKESALLGESTEALLELLGHPSAMVRQAGIRAMNELQPGGLEEQVRPYLGSPDPAVRESALRLLARLTGEQAAEKALKSTLLALTDPAGQVRRAAVELLAYFSDARAAAALAKAFQDPDEQTRISAAQACANLPTQQAREQILPLLLNASQDSSVWVRMHAVRALGNLGQPQGLPAVLNGLRDRFPPVRIAAVEAISQMDEPHVVEQYLQPLLHDEDAEVRRAARQKLNLVD